MDLFVNWNKKNCFVLIIIVSSFGIYIDSIIKLGFFFSLILLIILI